MSFAVLGTSGTLLQKSFFFFFLNITGPQNETQTTALCSKMCKFIWSNWKQSHSTNKRQMFIKILILNSFVKDISNNKKKSNTITDACRNLYQSPVNLVSKADHKPCFWFLCETQSWSLSMLCVSGSLLGTLSLHMAGECHSLKLIPMFEAVNRY